ncbi:MAG: hypothetical protein DRI93_01580 [Aquificota bacterium]|nr:MAG: hypothetical protein DRI93_01580 [Aquificota bacterium]
MKAKPEGVFAPPAHPKKATRDARLTQIYEGTNQINRLAIIEGQLGAEFEIGDFYSL